jgi:hypothetical protein
MNVTTSDVQEILILSLATLPIQLRHPSDDPRKPREAIPLLLPPSLIVK